MTDHSLNLLVVLTNQTTPTVVQTKVRFGNYDMIVLIPSLKISLGDKYIQIQDQDAHYSVYINRNSYHTNPIPLYGRHVCGVSVDDYNVVVLSVGTDLGGDFVNNIKELYPHKNLLVVYRSFPNKVFDIFTEECNSSTQQNSTSFYEKVLTRPFVLV
jgi:hypothetical protein